MQFLLRFAVTAVALYFIAMYIPGFSISHWYDAVIAAVIFGLVNAIIGPIVKLITLPLSLITLGGFSLVINWGLFWLTVIISPGFKTTGVPWPAWLATFVGAMIMMVLTMLFTMPMGKASDASSS